MTYNAPQPLTAENERLWAVLTHVSALVGIVIGVGTIGWLGPLIIFLVFKDRSAFVRQHAATTLNFQITMAIAAIIAFFFYFTIILFFIGFLITAAVYILTIVFSIIAAIAANRGEPYVYPLSIRFIR